MERTDPPMTGKICRWERAACGWRWTWRNWGRGFEPSAIAGSTPTLGGGSGPSGVGLVCVPQDRPYRRLGGAARPLAPPTVTDLEIALRRLVVDLTEEKIAFALSVASPFRSGLSHGLPAMRTLRYRLATTTWPKPSFDN